MTTEQYLRTLKKLGLTPASKATAAILGLSVRQIMRLSSGESRVPETLAKLLFMLERHGIPKDWRP